MSTLECLGDPILCGCSMDGALLKLLEEVLTLRENQRVLRHLVDDLATGFPDLAQRESQAELRAHLDDLLREQELSLKTCRQLQGLSANSELLARAERQLDLLDQEIHAVQGTLSG